MKSNLLTPERAINPPYHKELEIFECEDCGGIGFYTERDEEDEDYIQIECTRCSGLGFLEQDEEEEEGEW